MKRAARPPADAISGNSDDACSSNAHAFIFSNARALGSKNTCDPSSSNVRNPRVRTRDLGPASTAILVLGLGLYLSWSMVGMSPSLFSFSGSANQSLLDAGFFAQKAVSILVLGVFAFVSFRRDNLPERPIAIISALCMSAGTILRFADTGTIGAPSGAFVASQVLIAASSVFMVLWAQCLCTATLRKTLTCVASSYALSFVLSITASYLEGAAAAVFYASLPVLSAVLFSVFDREDVKPISSEKETAMEGTPYRFFTGVLVYGVLFALLTSASEMKSTAPNEFITLVAGLVAAAMIAVLVRVLPHELNYTLAFRWILPLLLIAMFAIFGFEQGQQDYEVFVVGFGWAYFRVFTFTIWRAIALRSKFPPLSIFILGALFLAPANLISLGLQNLLAYFGGTTLSTEILICSLAVLASTFLLSDHYLMGLLTPHEEPTRSMDEDTLRQHIQHVSEDSSLTQREQDIALLVAKGQNNLAIQNELFIADGTLRTHLRNMYKKLGVHSRKEMISLIRNYR